MIQKIISGGQTGADMGGLLAAEFLGIPLGGYCTSDLTNENGKNEDFETRFKMQKGGTLKERTLKNIQTSDATVIFSKDLKSSGTQYTIKCCEQVNKRYYIVENLSGLKSFIRKVDGILNIAGNRESVCPGIEERVRDFLILALIPENGVFVFGSNSKGIHGAGAALFAKKYLGAKEGIAEGLMGNSYALVTKDDFRTRKSTELADIGKSINKLYSFIKYNPDKMFFVTKIACGLAGYSEKEIAPLFKCFRETPLENVVIPEIFMIEEPEIKQEKEVKEIYLNKEEQRKDEIFISAFEPEVKKEVAKGDFVHLHVHSSLSLLDGLCEFDELCARVKELGQAAVAVTDHGYMYGSYKFQKEADKAGVKAIHGVEAYFVNDALDKSQRSNYHLILLVMNQKGWENICHMMTVANRDRFYYRPRIDEELLANYNEGLICTSACYKSPISYHMMEEGYDPERARKNAMFLKKVFGDRFYNEAMKIGFPDYDDYYPRVLELANELKIKTVATNDCLIKGTTIISKDGPKDIEDIKIGDMVLTHKNRWRKVSAINKRLINAEEDIYNVIPLLGTEGVTLTGNHPLLAYKRKSKYQNKFDKEEWINASNIGKGDYITIPKISKIERNIRKRDFIDLSEWFSEKNKMIKEDETNFILRGGNGKSISTIVPKKITLTKEFLYILGKFLADGSCDKSSNQVSFSFHKKEEENINIVNSFFSSLGISVCRGEEGNGVKLFFSSKVFSTVFKKMFGEGSNNKHFPKISPDSDIDNSWTKEQIFEILKGYIMGGDGHIPSEKSKSAIGFMVATVSKRLAWELYYYFGLFGQVSIPMKRNYSLKKHNHKNINANSDNWNNLYCLNFSKKSKELFFNMKEEIKIRASAIDCKDKYRNIVKSVNKIDYSDYVYNFSVEEDESYIANGLIVHNCHFIKKEDYSLQSTLINITTDGKMKSESPELYLKSRKEMIQGYITEEMCDTSLEIADRIDFELKFSGYKFPKFNIRDNDDFKLFEKENKCVLK